jgi:hypothetical protein
MARHFISSNASEVGGAITLRFISASERFLAVIGGGKTVLLPLLAAPKG